MYSVDTCGSSSPCHLGGASLLLQDTGLCSHFTGHYPGLKKNSLLVPGDLLSPKQLLLKVRGGVYKPTGTELLYAHLCLRAWSLGSELCRWLPLLTGSPQMRLCAGRFEMTHPKSRLDRCVRVPRVTRSWFFSYFSSIAHQAKIREFFVRETPVFSRLFLKGDGENINRTLFLWNMVLNSQFLSVRERGGQ